MAGSMLRIVALVGVSLGALAATAGAAQDGPPRRGQAADEERVVVFPREWRESYPFSLRFADTEGAEHVIDLAATRFATDRLVTLAGRRTFREPDLSTFPVSNVRQAFEVGTRDLFIVQVADPKAQAALRRRLEQERIPILGYIPNDAYLLRLDPRTHSLLSALEEVFWVGLFQPAYRVAPDLDYILEADPGHQLKLRLRLDPEDYPSEDDVRAMLGTVPEASVIDVIRTSRDWIVRVEGPVTLARTFAVRPGCLWVERFVEFQLDNNIARTSTSVATGRGASSGPIMDVEDVWKRGIHGEGQIASAADTGLSTGDITTADSLHWDFGQVGSATNPMRVIRGYALGRSSTWDDNQTTGGGHGTHTSGSIVGNGKQSGSSPEVNDFPTTSFTGIAPKARFVFQSVMDSSGTDGNPSLGGIPGDLRTLFLQTYKDGARVHSNSWGAPANGAYDTNSQSVDDFAWTYKDMVITFSAGNSGVDAVASNGVIDTDSIGAPGTAKNCITVGASENYRPTFIYEFPSNDCTGTAFTQAAWGWFNGLSFPFAPISADLMANNASGMAPFSSRGPTDDSRFKPDITAPGVAIISTRTNMNQAYEQWGICSVPVAQRPYYMTMGGTSMANPLTAGAATLVRQYYADGWHANSSDVTYAASVPAQGFNPSSALVKATLVNGAWDMAPGQYGSTAPQPEIPPNWDVAASRNLPNNAEGYGRVDLEASLFPGSGFGRNAARSMHVRDVTSGLGTGGRNSYTYNVLSAADPLIATLAWTDPYATTGVGTKLVNNLDLEVTSPSGQRYQANRLNYPVAAFVHDILNNVEQVKVIAPTAGNWTIDVVGTSVPGNGVAGTTTQPYALVLSAVTCAVPAVPTGLAAVPGGNNRIDLSWSSAAGAAEYRVYRGTDPGAQTSLVGTVTAPTTSFTDTTAAPGSTYFYVVRSASGGCESAASAEASATATTGLCFVGPDFAGLASVTNTANSTCSLDLSWGPATAPCAGAVSYSVYRSTSSGFTPSLANRIAAGLTTTSYTDSSALNQGIAYYYLVRATDEGNGVQEGNTTYRSAIPWGAPFNQTRFGPYSFDSDTDGTFPAGWSRNYFSGNSTDWRGVQTCSPTNSGAKILRFGGATCAGGYAIGTHSYAMATVVMTNGASNVRLSFWHRWDFQAGHDGGYLRIAFGGTPAYYVPGFTMLSGAYNVGTIPDLGVPVWQGNQSTFVNTVVDLEAACRVIDAAGCAGRTVYVLFTAYSDANAGGTYTGWFIDDVQVTADVPGACSSSPMPVQFFTARSTSNTNLLEWKNPATGPYSFGIVRYRTDGIFPTSVSDGTGVTCSVQTTSLNAYNSCSHSAPNGPTYSYSFFVDNGAFVYSPPRTVAATPFVTTGARKWAYSTGASNLASAGLLPGAKGTGVVFALSNDRALHAVDPTAAGGSWPRTAPFAWTPLAMNAPAQHRPPVVPLAAGPRVFLASQDGYAYAVNARTGAVVWTSAKLGDMLQANPAGLFSDLRPGAPNLLFVGTRNATSPNILYALNPATGAIVTQFNNGGGANAIGIITGITVDYATNYVYFTSRAFGSSHTLWCLNASGGTLVKVWSLPVGDIDGSPVLYQGRVYVGTNAGEVKAIDPSGPTVVWTYTCSPADGPVKGYVFPHFGSSPVRLYFATTNRLWAIVDNGGTAGTGWSVATVASPSTPLHVIGTNHLVVGSGNGTLYEISTVDGSQEGSVSLGSSALGSPARDSVNGLIHVGSTAGVLHAVTLPVP